MQLKETGAGEVTVWLAEIAVTIGETSNNGEEEDTEHRERWNEKLVTMLSIYSYVIISTPDHHICFKFPSDHLCPSKYTVDQTTTIYLRRVLQLVSYRSTVTVHIHEAMCIVMYTCEPLF